MLTSQAQNQSIYWTFFSLFSQGSVWFCILAVTVLSIIPDIIIKVSENTLERKQLNAYKTEEHLRIMGRNYSGYMKFVQYPRLPILESDKPRKFKKRRQNRVSITKIQQPVNSNITNIQYISKSYVEYNPSNRNQPDSVS